MPRERGATDRDLAIRKLQAEVKALQAALDVATSELLDDEQADDDHTPDRKDG